MVHAGELGPHLARRVAPRTAARRTAAQIDGLLLLRAARAPGAGVAAAAAEVEATNRKRKAEQTEAGPRLMRLEAEWVQGVKKNLEIESQCLRLENEVAAMRSGR